MNEHYQPPSRTDTKEEKPSPNVSHVKAFSPYFNETFLGEKNS